MRKKINKRYLEDEILPAVVYGAVSGTLTGAAVVLYKFLASKAIHFSEVGYGILQEHSIWAIPLLCVLGVVAAIVAAIYKWMPTLQGGGIPTSIAALRGSISFRPLINLVGTTLLSLLSFTIGVPLGNEGPAVQIGTALGKAGTRVTRKGKGWTRLSMTGGACAGFSTATGAPISGILFAIEEAHGRLSPLILIVSSVAVLFARLVSAVLCPLLGVSEQLFHAFALPALQARDLWIPLLVGVSGGLFAVAFLWVYRRLHRLFNERLRIHTRYKLLIVYALTVAAGMLSFSCVSTGHHLIETLFLHTTPLAVLAVLLVVRTVLTLSANCNGVTGGLFLPIMALGALLAAILGRICVALGMDPALQTAFILFGITASVSGMMKTPLIAIVFSVEALSLTDNILAVIITALMSFIIPALFGAESITDHVSEVRAANTRRGKTSHTATTTVTVAASAFAVGKEVRDILWPEGSFVLSVTHPQSGESDNAHGGKSIAAGDILEVRYTTFDTAKTLAALEEIVGE